MFGEHDEALFRVEVGAAQTVGFAAAQNDISIIKRLSVTNESPDQIGPLQLRLRAQPPFLREKVWTADRIGPGETLSFSKLDTDLDLSFLDTLNEAEKGTLTFTLEAEGCVLREIRAPIEVLPRDQWGGSGDEPQLLAAFVAPNDPRVAQLLRSASKLLEEAGHRSSIEGYQSKDPGRAYMIAAAVWSAAAGLSLSYAEPPRSFEAIGQKVRSPIEVMERKLATCLDTSLLLNSALEAAGLNPVVIFTEGHALSGVWLVERTLRMTVEPDVVEIRKHVQAGELVLFETTLLCERPTIGFDQAVKAGKRQIDESHETSFRQAIDLKRARNAGIKPLSSRQEVVLPADEDETAPPALPPVPAIETLAADEEHEVPSTPVGRIERWQRKLLDLSLRNRLLNFKPTKQTVPLLCPDVGRVEDALATEETLRLISLDDDGPAGRRGNDLLSAAAAKSEIEADFARQALEEEQLCVPLPQADMASRLTTLYRRAKSDLAEGGTNTLFLAAGFLRWRKRPDDQTSYKAPILLLPLRLDRRSANSAFVLRGHDDDIHVNHTLLQMLERDFDLKIPALLGDLPTDESGYDLPKIFEIVRRAVRDVAGFEVAEEAAISTFSFAKYLMWKDLVDRTDSLRENRLVKHLIDSPDQPFAGDGAGIVALDDIDRRILPKDLYTPLPADSSQLRAVVAASDGNDFVVVGPPGTGKSQTIANMIAHCLANGKTVLFVAEKSAALEVVYRRLRQFGLGDACLELHSNKADRKSAVQQLGRAWDRAVATSQREWLQVTEEIAVRRDELNSYVEALHRKASHGLSIFEAIGKVGSVPVSFELSFERMDAHDEESFARLRNIAGELGRRWGEIDEAEELEWLQTTSWSFGWQDNILLCAERLRSAIVALRPSLAHAADTFGLKASDVDTIETAKQLSSYGSFARSRRGQGAEELFGKALTELKSSLDSLRSSCEALDEARSKAAARYENDEVLRIEIDQLDLSWREANAKTWPFSLFAKARVRKLLQSYAAEGNADPETDIAAIRTLQTNLAEVEHSPVSELTIFDGERTDIDKARQMIETAEEAMARAEALLRMASDPEKATLAARSLLGESPATEFPSELSERWKVFSDTLETFCGLAEAESIPGSLSEAEDWAEQLASRKPDLEAWTKWQAVRSEAVANRLGPLVEAIENGLDLDVTEAFEKAYFAWWLPRALDEEPVLRRFSGREHERGIERFRALEEASQKLASEQVLLRISGDLPAKDTVPKKSELGVLRHQVSLQRPSVPIRKLIEQMPTAFTKLAPCVLMSPLSVAQYLPAGQAAFDVVIFDEASQITTWDAVGAIARGRQSVIVGDPKQLPPTNFFGKTDDDDDEDLDFHEKDLPSILDEASASGLPELYLSWHYRSRDERLIAFSNHHYYGDRLVTFPAPIAEGRMPVLHQVKGVYARGGGSFNEIEAKAVVDYAVSRLNEWLKWPDESRPTIGVVTFNKQQQELILDLFDQARQSSPELEWFFSEGRDEPVIVRNLENVQGDERDIMLFSITFGPDKAGKTSMNFGAVNKDGGEKRLNVAVTRARRELHVFASMGADAIDLNRTKARGVRDLKGFLDYAARGPVALPAIDEGSVGPADSPFEEAVAEALRAKGWEVRPQIGVSGFRIDLGVIHPDKAGAYLCGIECDGATYHRSATARDRDQVREGVLRGLGWEIIRIWSTDWFKNRQRTLDEVSAKIEELLEQARAEEGADDGSAAREEIEGREDHPAPSDAKPADQISRDAQYSLQASDEQVVASAATLDAEQFFDDEYTPFLTKFVEDTVSAHGPLREKKLAQEVARAHGWQRSGRRIRERVTDCLGCCLRITDDGAAFIWPPKSFADVIPFREGLGRSPRDVPKAEIRFLLKNEPELRSAADPALGLARRMGIARLSEDGRNYLTEVIAELGVQPDNSSTMSRTIP